jgi:hypothetical protein
MAELFEASDSVLHVFSEAIPGHERVVEAVVLDNAGPGKFLITTPMGIAIVVPEEKLTPQDGPAPVVPVSVPGDVAALLAIAAATQANTDAIHGKDVQTEIDAAAAAVQAAVDNLTSAVTPDQEVQAKLDAAVADIRAAITRLTEA